MIGEPLIPEPDDSLLRQQLANRRFLDEQWMNTSYVGLIVMVLYVAYATARGTL